MTIEISNSREVFVAIGVGARDSVVGVGGGKGEGCLGCDEC